MSDSVMVETDYAAEIREWLVGRLSRSRTSLSIRQSLGVGTPPRALLWWLLEGKTYPWLGGHLCDHWATIDRHARRLLRTLNPAWRMTDAPEGEIDWYLSALATTRAQRRQYWVRGSRTGLGDEERAALLGWMDWVRDRWHVYCADVGSPEGIDWLPEWLEAPAGASGDLAAEDDRPRGAAGSTAAIEAGTLRRWAHAAKRSRWPLLRNVVAESIRCELEDQRLDRLPLPTEHATLFELVCMVRILRTLDRNEGHIRWLDPSTNRNTVQISNARYVYQRSVPRERVLATYEFDDVLRAAVNRHGLRVSNQLDGWVEIFDADSPYRGIIVEAKSGAQGYDAAVYQLKCYRAVLREEIQEPIVMWGIVEQSDKPGAHALPETLPPGEDLWVFSTADEIPDVMQRLGLAGHA